MSPTRVDGAILDYRRVTPAARLGPGRPGRFALGGKSRPDYRPSHRGPRRVARPWDRRMVGESNLRSLLQRVCVAKHAGEHLCHRDSQAHRGRLSALTARWSCSACRAWYGSVGRSNPHTSGRNRMRRIKAASRYWALAVLMSMVILPVLEVQPAGAAGPDPQGTIYVSDGEANAIDVFAPGSSGNVAPERVIQGADTGLDGPTDVKVDPSGDVWASNFSNDSITEYAPGASGDASPICRSDKFRRASTRTTTCPSNQTAR